MMNIDGIEISAMCLPWIDTILYDYGDPSPSSFVPSAHMMYYILHCMDKEIYNNEHFVKHNQFWNPLLSRIYYGILFHIQTLRCMKHVDKLDYEASNFLRYFLEAYPVDRLVIAGPLVPVFQALTVSGSEHHNGRKVYPTLNTQNIIESKQAFTHEVTKDEEGAGIVRDVSDGLKLQIRRTILLLPNMYGLFGLLAKITSTQWKALASSENYPISFDPFLRIQPAVDERIIEDRTFNGLDMGTSLEDSSEMIRFLFACPGMTYELETTSRANKRFTNLGDKLHIPKYGQGVEKFDIMDYLNLRDLSWFRCVLSIMTSHSNYFKNQSTLDKCSLNGPAANQIIIVYEKPPEATELPKFFGHEACRLPLAFKAYLSNPDVTDEEKRLAFAAQINVCFPGNYLSRGTYVFRKDLPLIDKEGPFWYVPSFNMKTHLVENTHDRIPRFIQDNLCIDKPEKNDQSEYSFNRNLI